MSATRNITIGLYGNYSTAVHMLQRHADGVYQMSAPHYYSVKHCGYTITGQTLQRAVRVEDSQLTAHFYTPPESSGVKTPLIKKVDSIMCMIDLLGTDDSISEEIDGIVKEAKSNYGDDIPIILAGVLEEKLELKHEQTPKSEHYTQLLESERKKHNLSGAFVGNPEEGVGVDDGFIKTVSIAHQHVQTLSARPRSIVSRAPETEEVKEENTRPNMKKTLANAFFGASVATIAILGIVGVLSSKIVLPTLAIIGAAYFIGYMIKAIADYCKRRSHAANANSLWHSQPRYPSSLDPVPSAFLHAPGTRR